MRPSTCGDHRSRCNGGKPEAPACFFWRPSGAEAAQARVRSQASAMAFQLHRSAYLAYVYQRILMSPSSGTVVYALMLER